jgi:hypothetical protein
MLAPTINRVQPASTTGAVCYSSQASFSRTFLNVVGLPPAEWLKRDGCETGEDVPPLTARAYNLLKIFTPREHR